MKNYTFLITALALTAGCGTGHEKDPARYVDPFIGTAYTGHTFPGACVPFGLVQASPETGNDSWKYCGGYNIEDELITGFAQTHINGTGCQDLGDILIFPFCGEVKEGVYKSAYDRKTQTASPGYYSVSLTDSGVDAEVTATERTAFYRFAYRGEGAPRMLLDLQSGIVWSPEWISKHVLGSQIEMPDSLTIRGHQHLRNWVERDLFYTIHFDTPYTLAGELPRNEGEKAGRYILQFDSGRGKTVQVKIAVSTVGTEGAQNSLAAENPGWDFGKVRKEARAKWNELLSRVEAEGNDPQKTAFYTSLYHLFIQPTDITDTDGRYRGADNRVKVSESGQYYSTLSLWDTYRAAHPLYTLISPEKVDALVNSMLAHYDAAGMLPVWTLWGKENYTMIGNHAVPVIADAYLKGFRGFDAERAFEAVRTSLTRSHRNSDWETYVKYGYYPFDIITRESVSRTLESVYDDYAAAELARALGKSADYEYFSRRAGFYRNLFDPKTRLMRGRDSEGKWRDPFNPYAYSHSVLHGGDYTEGNAWHYTWHVQHDPEGLMEMMGGAAAFGSRLEELFTKQVGTELTGEVLDVTGLIGQYAHGNEPCHHVAYLFNYAGMPHRTQELVRQITEQFYRPEPDGLCGNDDCGQMSAWYVFSAMGFYPVNPVGGEYILGAPQMEKITINLPGGRKFTIRAEGISETAKYVEKTELNGQELSGFRIRHHDIMRGGELVFHMTDKQKNINAKYINSK